MHNRAENVWNWIINQHIASFKFYNVNNTVKMLKTRGQRAAASKKKKASVSSGKENDKIHRKENIDMWYMSVENRQRRVIKTYSRKHPLQVNWSAIICEKDNAINKGLSSVTLLGLRRSELVLF